MDNEEDYKDDYDEVKSRLRCISSKYIRKTGLNDGRTIEEDMEFLATYAMETTARLNTMTVMFAETSRKHPRVVKD